MKIHVLRRLKLPVFIKGILLLVGIALLVLLISIGDEAGMYGAVVLLGCGALILLYSLGVQLHKAIASSFRRLYAKDFYLKFMATLMGFFLVLGTLLYMYVFYVIGHDHHVAFSNAEYLLRSVICSLDLFMLDVDSNLLDRLDSHGALKGWLAVQAVLSFSCTVAMLVGVVYSRLHAYYRLNFRTKINDSHNHLYLFFGNNKPSELLIKDIVANDPKAVAIIIDEANIKDDTNNEWEGIVGLIGHKQTIFKTAEKIGAHVAIASHQLDEIDDEITARADFDAFDYLGLPKIKKFISRLSVTSKPQLHIFFMDDDEELNIRNIMVLAKDSTIMSVAKDKNLNHRIYCHARYNGPNRVVEDVALKKHLHVKIVDSSHMAVELLKLNPEYHPVNVVDVSRDIPATVESPLHTLIIGFGEVGRDAFRFLYEFGAFVSSTDYGHRSPFECIIVDKNVDNLKGTFMASMPAIFHQQPNGEFKCDSVRFESIDYHSEQFYSKVLTEQLAKDINYVIISIGNNDEAIALATRIFTRVRRFRDNMSNLRIFVRCTDDRKVEGVRHIADHYNYGYGDGKSNVPVIHVFGQPENTYTYDLVVSDRLIENGKLFYEQYRVLNGGNKSWDERHKALTETATPNIENLRKLRRQESQDRANALHAATKMILLKDAMTVVAAKNGSRPDWQSFCQNYFDVDGQACVEGSKTQILYPHLSPQENKIILHLAMLEHIRWNAAIELMGYVFDDRYDERTMQHNCLCDWNMLDVQSNKSADSSCDYKKYDYGVIDTTISLNRHNLTDQ